VRRTLTFLVPAFLPAQQPPEIRPKRASATLQEDFGRIGSGRERSDGRYRSPTTRVSPSRVLAALRHPATFAAHLALIATLLPASSLAQVPALRLKPAAATLDEEFGRIYSVREIADGRVLISDNSSASRLVVADLATGVVKELGRAGNGPGEYQHPAGRLLALLNDSTLFVSRNRPPRWVILHGAEIIESVPGDSKAFLAANNAVGADDRGNVIAHRTLAGGGNARRSAPGGRRGPGEPPHAPRRHRRPTGRNAVHGSAGRDFATAVLDRNGTSLFGG
jgi:hypothetical protein